MVKTIFGLLFVMLFATFSYAQTEEPDWQDVSTHRLDPEGTTFPKEAEDAVLKAISNDKKLGKDVSIKVTNFVEFCVDVPYKRCFAAALYKVDPSVNYLDEMQFLVWLDRIPDGRSEYRKLWEHRTEPVNASGSLTLVDAPSISFTTSCLLVKTVDDSNAAHGVDMKMLCLNQSDLPETLWEYNCDYTHESLAQAFRKSIVIFRDVDDNGVNELILDTVEGYKAGFDQGDTKFQITMHRTVFYYSDTAGKYLGTGSVPCD